MTDFYLKPLIEAEVRNIKKLLQTSSATITVIIVLTVAEGSWLSLPISVHVET